MRLRVKAVQVFGKDLEPGDLFSTAGQEYWDGVLASLATIGERVYVRTNAACPVAQRDVPIYRVTLTLES